MKIALKILVGMLIGFGIAFGLFWVATETGAATPTPVPVSALTPVTTVTPDALLYIVHDPDGSRVSRKTNVEAAVFAAVEPLTASNDRVGIDAPTPLAKLHVDQDTVDAAIPALLLDQADVSEPFTWYAGEAITATLTNNLVAAGDVTTATVAGYLEIYIADAGTGELIMDGSYYVPFYSME
jgi:hypothetical protein